MRLSDITFMLASFLTIPIKTSYF